MPSVDWNDHGHPIYALARVLIYMTSLTVLMAWNAQDFDITEIRTIVPMFLIASGAEGLSQLARIFGKNTS